MTAVVTIHVYNTCIYMYVSGYVDSGACCDGIANNTGQCVIQRDGYKLVFSSQQSLHVHVYTLYIRVHVCWKLLSNRSV